MASRKNIVKTVTMLSTLVPNWEINTAAFDLWEIALNDLTDDEVQRGVALFIRQSTSAYGNKIPRPGDIIDALQVSSGITWELAYKEAIEKHEAMISPPFYAGKYHPPVWSSPLIPEVIKAMGGPEQFKLLRPGDQATMRAQFRNAWRNAEERAGGRVMLEYHESEAPPALPEPEQHEAPQIGLSAEQQAKANTLKDRLLESHGNTPQDKLIRLVSNKLANKRSMSLPAPQGWQEDVKRGAVND